MLFNSSLFIVFFVIVYLAYLGLARSTKAQNGLLLFSSYVFYGAWDYRFLVLIIGSTGLDFIVARKMANAGSQRTRRMLLAVSLTSNLGILAAFKYMGFAIDSLMELLSLFGLDLSMPVARIAVPVGISFYTFQTLGYTIDVYRKRIDACRDWLTFAVYVAFFPQLVAGPIERAKHFLPQLQRARRIRRTDLAIGTQFVVLGYFLKVVLADSVAPPVDQFYADPSRYDSAIAWLATLGFSTQIYGDFAGYSLIARGLARWMGFRLITNFQQPYLAASPRDFWRRWHRSLSIWLRQYLYIELGGSRGGMLKTCRNLMLTMFLGGLWHGAGWNFLIWGVYHGLLLVANHLWIRWRAHAHVQTGQRLTTNSGTSTGMIFLMFILTLIGWTFFRCSSVDQIYLVLGQLLRFEWTDPRATAFAIPILTATATMLGIDLWRESVGSQLFLIRSTPLVRFMAYTVMIGAIVSCGFRPTQFLYFQF